MKLAPHAIVDFTLRISSGGKFPQLHPRGIFGCPMVIDGAYHDCRLQIGNTPMQPGEKRRVQVWFLDPATVLPKLSVGKEVSFWTAGDIGDGVVVEITPVPS